MTLHNLNRPSVRQVAEVTGLLVATFPAVQYLKLFYRSVEACNQLMFFQVPYTKYFRYCCAYSRPEKCTRGLLFSDF